jgi:N-acetylneuraminic acid mutarotase
MVAHKNNLILLGGFTALNAPGEEHDLHSQAKVLSFDTQTEEWSELPPLPEPRSSHDAAIVGNTIFVVGGWNMQGEEQTVWHQTAWKLDLSASHPEWSKIADPPFQHRALAVVANAERLFAIGGMDESNGPTKTVHIYDPQADSWSAGPNLPGEGSMAGFGASGWRVPSGLVVTTYEGDILQLADSKSSWELLGKTQSARFFHRLLPLEKNVLVSIGGANMNQGKFLKIETMVVR